MTFSRPHGPPRPRSVPLRVVQTCDHAFTDDASFQLRNRRNDGEHRFARRRRRVQRLLVRHEVDPNCTILFEREHELLHASREKPNKIFLALRNCRTVLVQVNRVRNAHAEQCLMRNIIVASTTSQGTTADSQVTPQRRSRRQRQPSHDSSVPRSNGRPSARSSSRRTRSNSSWRRRPGKWAPMTMDEAERCMRKSFGPSSIQKQWQYYLDKDAVRPNHNRASSGFPDPMIQETCVLESLAFARRRLLRSPERSALMSRPP
jgi:hypothetical protein